MGYDFDTTDLEASLRRAFVDRKFQTILYDGHTARNSFLRQSMDYGIELGWLFVESEVNESQYTAQNLALTDEGKKHFCLESKTEESKQDLSFRT